MCNAFQQLFMYHTLSIRAQLCAYFESFTSINMRAILNTNINNQKRLALRSKFLLRFLVCNSSDELYTVMPDCFKVLQNTFNE